MRLELFRPYGLRALYGLRARGSYGMTETSPAISMLPAECHTAGNPKLRSVGRPVPWAEVRTDRPPVTCTAGAILPSAARGAKQTPAAHGPQPPLRLRFDGASPRYVRCTALRCTHAANYLRCGGVPVEQPRQYAKLASSHSVVERPAWSAPNLPCGLPAPRRLRALDRVQVRFG